MTINAETAQLILDAIAWCNKGWWNALDMNDITEEYEIGQARIDFMQFCEERGIKYVEVSK